MNLVFVALLVVGVFVVEGYPVKEIEDQVPLPASRSQRQAGGGGHHDAVDFGAHTGDHGAFGWYADFPVHGH